MVPHPKKQNPQRQPLTTSLRKVCRDYPAGPGILNELLQNADDAGASTVRFVLDTRSYSETPVLVDGLFEYQGPALLIYNDALFSEEDFQSLTSLGDSKKLQDRNATGKFGLGFSSVFNWTDCPSIISGSNLLCLDPHHSWSHIFDPPGGPTYDISANLAEERMINQLRCFSLLCKDWDRPFEGSIIRIPLRTLSQAERSEISSKPTAAAEIMCAMNSFAEEMGAEGLLFLKSVQRITLEVDDKRCDEVNIVNWEELVNAKLHFGKIVRDLLNDQNRADHESYHEVHLRHWTPERETVKLYGVLNLAVDSLNDRILETWAASEKLFPWVAVAAPLKSDEYDRGGRLFSTLPLPISTGLPLHINGLFSISTDRSRLHGTEPDSVQDYRPERWNRYLFEETIPKAWAKLLYNVARDHPSENHFYLWPAKTSSAQELWHGMCPAVLQEVSRNNLPVWFTEFGHVSLRDGLMASDQISLQKRKMFSDTKLAIILLSEDLFDEACLLKDDRILRPKTLCERLQHTKSIENMPRESRLTLLEFLLPEMSISDIATFEIFPFQDGKFRSLDMLAIFLNRDDLENQVFGRQLENTIDIRQLTEAAAMIFHEQVRQDDRIVRYRTSGDLRDYCLQYVANETNEILMLDDEGRRMLNNIWTWIFKYGEDEANLTALRSVFLVPLQSGGLRRLAPMDDSDFVTWFRAGPTRDVSLKLVALDPTNSPNVLAEHVLSDAVLRRLLDLANRKPSLSLQDGHSFLHYLSFLAQGRSLLSTAAEDTTCPLLSTLRQLYLAESPKVPASACEKFRSLCLFTAVRWSTGSAGHSAERHKVDLRGEFEFLGLRKLVPIPPSPGRVFLDATEEGVRQLFEQVGSLRCLDEHEILEELVIPALQTGSYDALNSEMRLEAINILFSNYHQLSKTARVHLSDLPVVPMHKKSDFDLSFGLPLDVLDLRKPELACLYFENEVRYPDTKFYDRFENILAICGMIQSLSERVILNRIEEYCKGEHEVNEVTMRAKNLLQMPLHPGVPYSVYLIDILRQRKWLPTNTDDTTHPFSKAAECRDIRDKLIVGHIWHVLPFLVDDSWKSVLGWHDCISVKTLMAQLVASIAASDLLSVEMTLCYLHQNHSMESYASSLLDLEFVRNTAGELVSIAVVCREGAERLTPYLHMVESRFWDDHNDLMKFAGVPLLPSKEHLLHIQSVLRTKQPLSEENLDVAVEVANIWGLRYAESVDGLSLVATTGVLVDVGDLSYDDVPWELVENHVTAHPKISRTVAARLKVRCLSDVLRYGLLGISDVDDGEFNQREEVADGIRDTLERYTRESTFHEYVANADDCSSASEINFLVDGRTYDSKDVLTEELKGLQGPSLLIHNNGVFTDADFDGFKYVGRGSKRDDPTTIGKFGRGSQTMYHWTDVPMILSGSSLLILDPMRKYLPYNYRTKQKMPGIKLEYAKLKSNCPDQIVPFEGLWGFDSTQNYYHGTIFRFPLRQENEESELVESLRHPGISSVIQIFRDSLDVARSALLFLRNVIVIDFSVNRDGPSDWSVRRGYWPDSFTYSDWANIDVEVDRPDAERIRASERWWRVMVDVSDAPADLQYRHKRRMKYVECGIAAPIPADEKSTSSSLGPLQMRFFNYLPLKFESTLPVQIHATFLLTGDRQSIATEETSQDAGAAWNRWLLETQLPLVYLKFLEDLGRKIGEDAYRYFPVKVSDSPHSLSDLVRASFWEQIGSSSCRLFPINHNQDFESSAGKCRRTAPELITFEQSVFDILEQMKFDSLRRLLRGYRKNLVRLPLVLQQHVKDVPGVKILTPAIVRNILKSATPNEVERAVEMDNDFLKTLLFFIMPSSTEEIIDLHGCPVLPLLAGRIGTLSPRSTGDKETSASMYFSASIEHQQLFSFASSIFCEQDGNTKFVKAMVGSGLLNVKKLEKSDVGVMLIFRKLSDLESSSVRWLYRFWEYMNTQTDDTPLESFNLDTIHNIPLVAVRGSNDTENLKSLADFHTEPIVMESTNHAHMDLFSDFAGLLIADSKTLPIEYQETEKTLFDPRAAERFLRSIPILARKDGKSLTEYVRANLREKNIKTVQDLLVRNFAESSPPLPKAIKLFPLWPSVSAAQGHLTTQEVKVAKTLALVVPWITNYHKFTNFDEPFQATLVDDITMLKDYVLPTLPENLDEQTRSPYIRLIAAIARNSNLKQGTSKKSKTLRFIVPLDECRLAARGDGVLRRACDLFDHTDAIFLAAFRTQHELRFLLPDVRKHMIFWRELGVRSRGHGYQGKDYLTCLSALEERLAGDPDRYLASDARTIVNPLCINDGSLRLLDKPDWKTIAKLQIFSVRQDMRSEPEYRRQRMESLSSPKTTLCLQNIVRDEFAAVCWSQVSFTLQEPTTHAFVHCAHDGKPTCEVVWQHLVFLAELAPSLEENDVGDFVHDLQKTYEFLNLNPQGSKNSFVGTTAAIWWNSEALDLSNISMAMVKSSWTALENLLLDTPCDALPFTAVQNFLGRFSILLKGLECRSIYYPKINAPGNGRSDPGLSFIRELWKETSLTDVIFEAESREISAHKVVLASRSMYCKTQFGGVWASVLLGNAKKPIEVEDMSYTALQTLVSFCYGANEDWAACWRLQEDDKLLTIADKLDGLLDVLVAADRWLMPDLRAEAQGQVLAGIKFFVRPDNVKVVRTIADGANAVELRVYCDEYIACNAEAVLLASADTD